MALGKAKAVNSRSAASNVCVIVDDPPSECLETQASAPVVVHLHGGLQLFADDCFCQGTSEFS